MGCTTRFDGKFIIDRPVDAETEKKLRSVYYSDDTNIDGFPNGYCQWELAEDNQGIAWDGSEKFYDYIEWIEALIREILAPAGYKLNGKVIWSGEEVSDIGQITVIDNSVSVATGMEQMAKTISP